MSDKPLIRKTEARLAERRRARAEEQRKATMKKFIPVAIVFLVAVFVLFVGLTTLTQTSAQTIQGTVGPRLQVDRDNLDLGNQPLGKTVRAAFTVKNVGDGTLKLDVPRVASLLTGC